MFTVLKRVFLIILISTFASCAANAPDSNTLNPTQSNAQLPINVKPLTTMPSNPGHYILATKGIDNELIDILLENPEIKGVSTTYNWVDLEIQKGVYDFSRIENDLALLRPLNKQLIVMIRDKSFKHNLFIPVPNYMLTSEYQGGYAGGSSSLVAKRWVHKVGVRFRALLTSLGNHFNQDPNFEAIKTAESATGDISEFNDYDPIQYVNELNFTAGALAKAFPNKVKVMYLNWIPGATSSLAEVAAYAHVNGVGIGGPDVHPDIQIPAYDLYSPLKNEVPLMTDVQWSNFEHVYPTGDTDQLFNFAKSNLHTSYICWMLRKPYIQNILHTIKANPVL